MFEITNKLEYLYIIASLSRNSAKQNSAKFNNFFYPSLIKITFKKFMNELTLGTSRDLTSVGDVTLWALGLHSFLLKSTHFSAISHTGTK